MFNSTIEITQQWATFQHPKILYKGRIKLIASSSTAEIAVIRGDLNYNIWESRLEPITERDHIYIVCNCSFLGLPPVTLDIDFLAGKHLENGEFTTMSYDNGAVIIVGRYAIDYTAHNTFAHCIVKHENIPKISSSIQLNILYHPKRIIFQHIPVDSAYSRNLSDPSPGVEESSEYSTFLSSSQSLFTLRSGEQIACLADSNPPANTTWLKNLPSEQHEERASYKSSLLSRQSILAVDKTFFEHIVHINGSNLLIKSDIERFFINNSQKEQNNSSAINERKSFEFVATCVASNYFSKNSEDFSAVSFSKSRQFNFRVLGNSSDGIFDTLIVFLSSTLGLTYILLGLGVLLVLFLLGSILCIRCCTCDRCKKTPPSVDPINPKAFVKAPQVRKLPKKIPPNDNNPNNNNNKTNLPDTLPKESPKNDTNKINEKQTIETRTEDPFDSNKITNNRKKSFPSYNAAQNGYNDIGKSPINILSNMEKAHNLVPNSSTPSSNITQTSYSVGDEAYSPENVSLLLNEISSPTQNRFYAPSLAGTDLDSDFDLVDLNRQNLLVPYRNSIVEPVEEENSIDLRDTLINWSLPATQRYYDEYGDPIPTEV